MRSLRAAVCRCNCAATPTPCRASGGTPHCSVVVEEFAEPVGLHKAIGGTMSDVWWDETRLKLADGLREA